MDNIVQDRSGTLVSGVFYRFETFDDNLPPLVYTKTLGVLSARSPSPDELFIKGQEPWLQVVRDWNRGSEKELHRRCPLDKSHVTEQYWPKATFNYIRGSRLSPFIPDESAHDEQTIVSEFLAERLKKSGLTGFRFERVLIGENKTVAKDVKLFILQSLGQCCQRPLKVVGAPNACPHCGREPILCAHCGHPEIECAKCGKRAWTIRKEHQGAKDVRLVASPPEERFPKILEGRHWDGSDFIHAPRLFGQIGCFVTKRALDWFLSIHAAPFYAEPTPVNVDGMSKDQLAKLEAAKRPVEPKP